MEQLLERSFDFSIRIVELVKYLNEEKRPFLLEQRLLSCGTGVGVCLRLAQTDGRSHVIQAMSWAAEAEYLLEVMEKTGSLTYKQSVPILGDCRALKSLIASALRPERVKTTGEALV